MVWTLNVDGRVEISKDVGGRDRKIEGEESLDGEKKGIVKTRLYMVETLNTFLHH